MMNCTSILKMSASWSIIRLYLLRVVTFCKDYILLTHHILIKSYHWQFDNTLGINLWGQEHGIHICGIKPTHNPVWHREWYRIKHKNFMIEKKVLICQVELYILLTRYILMKSWWFVIFFINCSNTIFFINFSFAMPPHIPTSAFSMLKALLFSDKSNTYILSILSSFLWL